MAMSKLQALWNHPAGPKTIYAWAGVSIGNADYQTPPEKLSYTLQMVIIASGLITSRYSTVITPKNWNLFSVSLAMAATGIYQLTRKIEHDYASEAEPGVAKE